MNKKVIVCISILLLITGCGATYHYKAGDFNDINKEYTIDAKMRKVLETQFLATTTKNILSLYINNQLVLEGQLDIKQSGTFKSMYDGKQLILECYDKGAFVIDTYCQVHLDQRKIGSFKLKQEQR